MVENERDILILKYLTQQCSQGELDELHSWFDESPENRALLLKKKSLWDASHIPFSYESIDVDKAEQTVMDCILNTDDSDSRRKDFFRIFKHVAAAVVCACCGAGLLYLGQGHLNQGDDTYTVQTIRSACGGQTETVLPDGSKVWINSNSEISYSSNFVNDRRVSLSGEAYFEVKSNQEYPFLVNTKELTVRATGTAFNVNAYSQTSKSSVALVKGKVDVTLPDEKDFVLKAGERLVLDTNTDAVTVSSQELYSWYAWKDGILIFDDTPLKDVFQRLEQIFNVKFLLSDPKIGESLFHATFQGENLNEIIRLVEESAMVKCNIINAGFTTDSIRVSCIKVSTAV